jgi:hypothetical protein
MSAIVKKIENNVIAMIIVNTQASEALNEARHEHWKLELFTRCTAS